MYNRYIPQPDGTFVRSRIPEKEPDETTQNTQRESEHTPPPAQEPEQKNRQESRQNQPRQNGPYRQNNFRSARHNPSQSRDQNNEGIGNFLRQLLPKNFDTEDMIVVLLLLLMSGENSDDQNSALLTLVIYLFL